MEEGARNVIIALSAIMAFSWFISGATPGSSFGRIRNAFYYHFGYWVNKYLIIRKLRPEYKTVLQGAFYYYQNLKNKGQVAIREACSEVYRQKEVPPSWGSPGSDSRDENPDRGLCCAADLRAAARILS